MSSSHTPRHVVRPATTADAPALVALNQALLADGRGMVMGPSEGRGVEALRSGIGQASVYLVAERQGRLVGEVQVSTMGPAWLDHVGVLAMGVHPEAQGQGVGRGLLMAALEAARARFVRLELYVRADNPRAIGLYRSAGFVREGVRRAFVRAPGTTAVDDWLMARMLYAPVGTAFLWLARREVLVAVVEREREPAADDVLHALVPWDEPTETTGADGWPELQTVWAWEVRAEAVGEVRWMRREDVPGRWEEVVDRLPLRG
jgi:putative acetyltransferase